jgi:superfamily I DNA/RNA helicase
MNPDTIERIASHRGSHLRVLGPPASGKTTALVARFGALEDEGLRPAVITFSRAQRERLLERLMPAGTARAGRFPVHTYHRLALDVLAHAAPLARPPLGDVEERVVLARVLDDLDGSLESDFAAITRSDGLARTLLSIVHTLEQNGAGVDDATAALEKAKGRRTRDILRVFAGFEQTLQSRGLCTYYAVAGRATRAARTLADGANPLGDCGALLIDDFHDIDAGQFALVEALAPPTGERTVTVFGDPTGARFGFRGTDARFLDTMFPERYGGDDVVLPMPVSGLGAAATGLLEGAGVENPGRFAAEAVAVDDLPLFAVPGPGAGGGPEVTLTVADDDVAEAQHVARACAELIEEGTAPGDIAVIARDRGRYGLVLAHACDEFGVPLDNGEPERHELETFADALLGLLETRPDERLAGTVTDSPFYRALQANDLDDLVSCLRKDCFDRKTRVLGMQKFLDTAVRPAAARTPVSDEAIAAVARMADEWSAYEEMTAHIGARASIAEFRRRYRAAVSLERDPRCVAFHTAREAATHTFAVAFVVGCADGVFPALDVRESYVPYEELESLLAISFYEARDREQRLRDEYGLMLSAFTRGRAAVHASAARRVAGEEVPAPARVLEPLLAGAGRAARTEGPRTRSARLVAAAGHGTVSAATAAGTARVWLEPRLEVRRFAVEPFAVSPSRVEGYIQCPRKLFYTRILGVDEEKTVYLTIGSLFHAVMEKAARAMPNRDELVAGMTDERIAAIVEETIAETKDLGPRGSLLESLTRHYLERMAVQARGLERTRIGNYRIESEQMREFERGGRQYLGWLDRIDRVDDVPRVVVDYKASGGLHKTGKKIGENILDRAADKRYWQVAMYCYAARTGSRYPDLFCYYVVPPGEQAIVVGVYVSDDPERDARGDIFDQPAKRFATVAPHEIDTVMDEIDGIYDEIFAEREEFPRTEDTKRCEICSFAGLCERRTRS